MATTSILRLLAPALLLAAAAGCGDDEPAAPPPPPSPADRQAIRLAPGGTLEDHLAPGKATCVVFLLAGRPAADLDLDELGRREGLAVRTIELEDWASPLRERFDVQSVPWLVLFDREGRRVAAGYDRAVLDRLEDLR